MSPTRRRLIAVWAVLMGLTLAMAIAADVTHAAQPGAIWLIVIAVITTTKVRFVLGDYLGLRRNRAALNGMTVAVMVTLAVVTAAFIAVPR